MPQIINTNIASLTAQRNLNKSQSANQQALERLSSGLRINSAKDDAAGLAISTRFQSQIRGLNVAIRNAGDGISLAQTAEGALGTMNDNLQRIRELSVQSANATNSDVDRDALQAEVDQLLAEITRTAEETDFNGRKLLDGSFEATFQIGANAGQTVEISIAELTADKLGAGQEAGVSALGTDSAIANGDLIINGEGIRASSATDDTSSTQGADRSALAKAAAINDSTTDTGVAADVNINVAAGSEQILAETNGSITLNGITINMATGGLDATSDRAAVLTAINAVSGQTGVVAVDSGSADSGISLEAEDGRNIEIRFDKFDANGDAYDSQLTALATGLASGGSGAASGSVATSASVSGMLTISVFDTLAGTFDLAIDGEESISVTLTGSAATIEEVVTQLQSSIDTAITNNGLSASVTVTQTNNVISITSDSTGPNSSLVLDNVVTGGAASALEINAILGIGTGGAAFFTVSDLDAIYLADTGSNGVDKESASYSGITGLLENDGTVRTQAGAITYTSGNVTFSIQVDGGIAVDISVGAQVSAFTSPGDLAAYAADIETEINAALLADGQSGTVTVSTDDGYRLVITSDTEGVDSQLQISNATNQSRFVGIANSTSGIAPNDGVLGSDGVENASQTYEGSITLRSVNGDSINITSGSGSLSSTGLQDGEFKAGQAFASSQDRSVSGAIATSGQIVGEKTSIGGLDDAHIAGIAARLTMAFSIEVDGGDAVSVSYNQTAAAATEFDSLDSYLTGLETEINAALTSDGQTGSVSVSVNSDNQLVIASNTKGTTSEVNISNIVTAGGDIEEILNLGLRENLTGVGSSGAVATQAFVTGVGEHVAGATRGQNFSTALGVATFTITAETFRVSIDGGETIDVVIAANETVSDVTAALEFIEAEINDALTEAGQSGSVSIATDLDGYVTITSDAVGSGSSVEILSTNSGTADAFTQMAGLITYQKSSVAVDTVTTPDGLDSGDLIINGLAIESASAADDTASNTIALSSSKQASGIAMAAAINAVSEDTGVVATVNQTRLEGGEQVATATTDTPQQGSININGFETATLTTNGANGGADDRANAISAINAISGQTGVTAVDDGEGITLLADDGRNISVVINNNEKTAAESSGSFEALTGAAIGLNVAEADLDGGATFATTAQTAYSSVTLDGPGIIDIQTGSNGSAALEAIGFRVGQYGSTEAGTRLADLDISTLAGAEAAIKAIDNAIGAVASQRATLGAIQNRMDSTVNNLSITSNNLSAANSRIQDADFAAETAELSRSQVLQQAGISILAQANAAPQQVLSLLG